MKTERLEQMLAQNPRSPLFARLAEEFLRAQRLDEALTISLEGLRHFPGYAAGHVIAAKCLAQKNDLREAIGHLERAARVLPGNEVLTRMMSEWRAKGKQETEQRVGKRERRLAEVSSSPPVHYDASGADQALTDAPIVSVTLAEIYATQGAYEAAIAMYRKLQKQKPKQSARFEEKIQELEEKIRQRP